VAKYRVSERQCEADPLLFNVPEEVIRRRFAHGIINFDHYKVLVDRWQLYDNSGIPAVLIEEGQHI